MFTELGASTNVDNPKPHFTHPCEPRKVVNVMLDICHMLKLIRNMLRMQNTFDGNDRIIKWEEGLRLGNKLKQQHKLEEKYNESMPSSTGHQCQHC